jgi:hypothetical protein
MLHGAQKNKYIVPLLWWSGAAWTTLMLIVLRPERITITVLSPPKLSNLVLLEVSLCGFNEPTTGYGGVVASKQGG